MSDKPVYDNNMRGVLFRVPEKPTAKHPDYTGHVEIAGVKFHLAAWIKESKAGGEFISFSVMTDAERQEQIKKREAYAKAPATVRDEKARAKTPSKFDDLDDDIPF